MRTYLASLLLVTACGGSGDSADAGKAPDASVTAPDAQRPPSSDAALPPSGAAIVFITSNFYDGDLRTAGAGATGLEGADQLCQLHADAASLPGTYRAWLSSKTVDAIDRITGPGPWQNTRDEIVFQNRAQLQTHPIRTVGYDETGRALYPLVWTGTDVGREAPPQFSSDPTSTCNDWTSKSGATPGATYGDSGQSSSGAWSRNGYDGCYDTHALYCFAIAS
ncbi:MAG: hypothetical protein M3680_35660 [Myxococcota bacterium]|nr:hypothetical protein [Myxococcota bacterium]